MKSAIHRLPDRQAGEIASAYRRAHAGSRRQSLVFTGLMVVLILVAGRVAEVEPATFFANIGNFGSYLHEIVPTLRPAHLGGDLAAWYWHLGTWSSLLLDTLLMAYLGTLFGTAAGFCLCFCASANLMPNRAIRFAARRFLEICRTVPDIVFALIFVFAFGIGAMPGVFALAIHTTGALGKLFAEVVENIDMRPVQGVTATGGSWAQTVRYAVVPQVLPNFASYALLRFEINVRGAGVLGFVGAGGIGQEFLSAIREFYYSDVSAILVMMIVTVILIDLGTEWLRHRLGTVA